MRTWKSRYQELAAMWKVCYDRHAVKDRWIADCLEGRAKFLFRAGRGMSHDWMVYRMADGAILTVCNHYGELPGQVSTHDSLQAAIAFFGKMSDLPHNVEMRAKLAGVASDDAAAAVLERAQWADARRRMEAYWTVREEEGQRAAAEYRAGLAGGDPLMAGILVVPRG